MRLKIVASRRASRFVFLASNIRMIKLKGWDWQDMRHAWKRG